LRDHVVRTTGGEEYRVQKFAVTDSTLVILQLNQSDARYKNAKLPISLPLEEIETMKAIDRRETGFFVLVALGLLVAISAVSISLGG
jgi:hypothetical protein